MATAAAISVRAPSPSLRAGSPTPSRRASATPPVHLSPRASRRLSLDKENVSLHAAMEPNGKATAENGHDAAAVAAVPVANGRPRDGSVSEDDVDNVLRRRGAVPRSPRTVPRSPPPGVHTLPTIVAHVEMDSSALSDSEAHAPPPAPSAVFGTAAPGTEVRRRRRTSSIHVKPPPGVKPTKAVDWEIPRKAFHSSIGFLTLALKYTDPPSLRPLITVLCIMCVTIFTIDVIRLRFPAFAELWEMFVGFLMREEERNRINGVVWYLVGVIFVLSFYPRDVAVVAILTLSWSDTTASTLGRLWGRHTPPLPAHVPGLKFLPFAPRKSLAGFLAATVTGILIGLGYWAHQASDWAVLNTPGPFGLIATSLVVGFGGAVVEALDLGVDDNLTLPILSGAIVWAWFAATNVLLGH